MVENDPPFFWLIEHQNTNKDTIPSNQSINKLINCQLNQYNVHCEKINRGEAYVGDE